MPTAGKTSGARVKLVRQAIILAAALVLPWVFISLSLRSGLLSSTPLALSYAAIAALSLLAGWVPGLLGTLITTLIVNHLILAHRSGFALDPGSLLRSAIVFGIGVLVTILFDRQRVTSSRLNLTLASLQARTDALSEAQQGGNSVAWTMNLANKSIHWADGGSRIFGRPFHQLPDIDSTIPLILEEDRVNLANAAETAMRTSKAFDCEFRVRWPDGDIHWIATRGTPSAQHARLWRGVSIDVTDRKRAELALLRSEKLAAIGRLSATVAHEINNPLEAVTNLLYLAQTDPNLAPLTREYLLQADRELARLASIARHTLSFGNLRSPSGPSHIGEVLEGVTRMFQTKCDSRGAALRLLHSDSLLVPMPQDDLRQVFTNLLSNACDALPPSGGVIEIDLARIDNTATISIRDNGSGVAPQDVERIFDPFFTTKSDIGTGIGLWVSRELVHKSGGRISIQTHGLPAGFRTMFRVDLPLATATAFPPGVASAAQAQPGTSRSA